MTPQEYIDRSSETLTLYSGVGLLPSTNEYQIVPEQVDTAGRGFISAVYWGIKPTMPAKFTIPGYIRPTFQDRVRFQRLAHEWIKETAMYSDPVRVFMHRAHFKIIGMGEKALPLILGEVQNGSSADWFVALQSISLVNPIQPEDETSFEQTADAWIRWGKAEGLI